MTPDEYQKAVLRTASMDSDYMRKVATFGLGLAGESGEVVEMVKKFVGHRHPMENEKLKKELGDVLWYLAAIASEFQISLDDVMVANIEKLKKRYPEGFSAEASIARVDTKGSA